MDTKAYLHRIKYNDTVSPTSATLRQLQVAHFRSVPFENLDIHLGRPIALDLAALFDKIVIQRRGGFCYELNGLFAWLLRALKFRVTLLSASDAQPDGAFGPEFDHLALQVECPADPVPASPWLVDVGWGDTFSEPLRLDQLNVEQPDGLRAYRIDEDGQYYHLWQRNYDGSWERQYRFTLQPRRFSDFESMRHYHQTSPASLFTQNRICSLATVDGRISLDNSRLITTVKGQRDEQPVVDEATYNHLLKERFGVEL